MSRRRATIALLSALPLAAILLVWVKSYWAGDSFYWRTHSANYSLEDGRGQLWFAWHQARSPDRSFYRASINPPHEIRTGGGMAGDFGFFLDRARSRDGGSRFSLVMPFWSCALLLLLPPAACLALAMPALRRGRRVRRGQCPTCGYDLRATKGRCPECGCGISSY